MQEKPTGDLREELMQAPSIDTYIHDNQEIFAGQEITESLAELYDRKAISKAARYTSTRFSPGGAIPPGTGCCACASAWRPRWRRPSAC